MAAKGDPADIAAAASDSMWLDAMEWIEEQLLAEAEKAFGANELSALQAMQAAFFRHLKFYARHPGAPRIILGLLQQNADTAAKRSATRFYRGYAARLAKIIRKGQKRGEFDPSIDAEISAAFYLGAIHGLVVQTLVAGDVAAFAQGGPTAWRLLRYGLAPHAASSKSRGTPAS